MNIYAFYKPASAGLRDEEERGMVAKWKESWFRYGWNPIVLGIDDIEKDDFFWKYYDAVNNSPTANPKIFEMAAWLVYIAIYQSVKRNNDKLFCQAAFERPWRMPSSVYLLPCGGLVHLHAQSPGFA